MRKALFYLALYLMPFPAIAQVAISQLPSATTPLGGTEIVPIVQGGTTKNVSVANIQTSGSVSGNKVLASPNGSTGAPSFRALTATDMSALLGTANTWTSSQIIARGGDTTTDGTVTTTSTAHQIWRQASATSSGGAGSANEQSAFFSINIPSGHGSGIAYESEPLYTRCITADSNTFALNAYDCVGAEFQAITSGTGQLMRIWGADTTVNVVASSDAYATGYESDIVNNGTTGALQTATVKQNFFGVCLGPNKCTSVLTANATGTTYNYGVVFPKNIFTTGSPAISVVDSSASFANVAGFYADGHSMALQANYTIGAAATTRYSSYYTGANDSALSLRWNAGANATSESGSNAGSDYNICSYSDAGAFITCPFTITRSTGAISVGQISATTEFVGTDNITTGNVTTANITTNVAAGSVPTPSGTCSINTQAGGNRAGTFKANGACAGGTIILTFSSATGTGNSCVAQDMTTPADTIKQTAYSTTSVTFTATMAASDQAVFSCTGF